MAPRGSPAAGGRPRAVRLRLAIVDRGRPRTPRAFVERVVRAALRHVRRPQLPVSLLLTGDAEIGQLHARLFGDPAPTDVISLLLDGEAELAVSVETAARVARASGHSRRAEVALYIVHGLLHCCGYDDVHAAARARMRRAERAVMDALALEYATVDDVERVRRDAK